MQIFLDKSGFVRFNPSHMIKHFSVVVVAAFALASSAQAAKPGKGWKPLFNGQNLDGFKIVGGYATYEVKGKTIVGKTADGSKNTFLATTKSYANFELELEVKCEPALNSGIQIRSHVYKKDTPQASKPNRIREKGEIYGYQCEIANGDKGVSGNFWDEGRWTKWHDELSDEGKQAFKNSEWNKYLIVANGNRIQSWVNGVKCADFTSDLDSTGFIGLQVHGIKKGTGPFEVRWRNIRLRELK